jgi:plasmid maintenance system antidote protein VapI
MARWLSTLGKRSHAEGSFNVEIVVIKRFITADTDMRLCRCFGMSDGWWLRGQSNDDMAVAREKMGDALSKIRRCTLLVA